MTDKDIAIAAIGVPPVGALNKKPPHLILLGEGKGQKKFITVDKPDIGDNGFVQAKGIFAEENEATIIGNYANLLNSAQKEDFIEMTFPPHKVDSIRNLVFRSK
jgi:hypothetical protein